MRKSWPKIFHKILSRIKTSVCDPDTDQNISGSPYWVVDTTMTEVIFDNEVVFYSIHRKNITLEQKQTKIVLDRC